MKKYIDDEFNYCEVNSDCAVAWGICPLGPFFIVNKKQIDSLGAVLDKVRNKCIICDYKMPRPPTAFKCKNSRCYPDINEDLNIISFYWHDCQKIVDIYSEDLIGMNSNHMDLNEMLYRVISEDDLKNINSADPYDMNRVKLIIDKNGIIKSTTCDR
ncbi:MAG: hypothetical protein WBP41_16940 [Saprospiraceae bacterium]